MGQQGQGYETRDNSGTLFKNDRRENENHPHAKGKALIGGVWYWVSAWTKEGRSGGRYQSLSFQEMTEEQANRAVSRGGSGGQRQGGGDNGYGGGSRPPPQRQQAPQQQRRQAEPPFGDDKQFQEADIPF